MMPTKEQLIRYLVDPKKLPPDVREAIRSAEAQAGSDVSKWFAEMDRKLANPLESIDWLSMMSPSKPVRVQKVKAASKPATYRRFLPWVGFIAASAASVFFFVQLKQINHRLSQFDGRLSGITTTEVRSGKLERLARHLYAQRYEQAEEVANEVWEGFPDTRDQLRNDIVVIAEGLVAQGEPNRLLRFAERWPERFRRESGTFPIPAVLDRHALNAIAYSKLGDLKLAKSELRQYSSTRTREQEVSNELDAEFIRVAMAVDEYQLALAFGKRFLLSDRPTSEEVKTGLLVVDAALKLNDFGAAHMKLHDVLSNLRGMRENDAAEVLRRSTIVYVALGDPERSKWAFQKLKSDYQVEESLSRLPSFKRAFIDGIGYIVSDEPAKASDILQTVSMDETIVTSQRALIYGLLSYSRLNEGKEDLANKAAADSVAAASEADKSVQEQLAIAAGFVFCATNEVEKAEPLVNKLKQETAGRPGVTEEMADRIKILEARLAFAKGNLKDAINGLASISPTSRFNEVAKSLIIAINGGTLASNPTKGQAAMMSLLMLGI